MRPVRCSPLPPLKSAKVFSRLDLAPDFGSCSGVKYSFYWVEQCKVFILNGLWLVRHEKATSCAVAFRSPISTLYYSRLAKLTRHSSLLNNTFILFVIARFGEERGLDTFRGAERNSRSYIPTIAKCATADPSMRNVAPCARDHGFDPSQVVYEMAWVMIVLDTFRQACKLLEGSLASGGIHPDR